MPGPSYLGWRYLDRQPTLRAALWMVGTLAAFSTMAIAVRELHGQLGSFQILAFRSFFSIFILVAVIHWRGWHLLRSRRWGLHVTRNCVHFVGQFGWVHGLGLITLTQVFAIEFTAPIWAALLAVFLLGEKLNRYRVAAIILGFLGILVILRPGLAGVSQGALWVLLAAWAFAGTFIATKSLTMTEPPLTILFYMNLMQLPLGLLPALGNWVWPTPEFWPWIAAVVLAGLAAHYCLTRALQLADVSIVAPLDFLRLPLIALVAWLLYAEALDYFIFLGAALIFAGTYTNIREELKTRKY